MIIKELSVIFPIYNEEKRLKINLYKALKLFKSFRSIKIEIILVNDGSTDKTDEIIKIFNLSLSHQSPVTTHHSQFRWLPPHAADSTKDGPQQRWCGE